ncbi:MAG: multicopper oxidase domain-containing protein [Actinophytocola sp.]|nr:multicopper oxidase domain-containing protein [Actinophytocola sp.]
MARSLRVRAGEPVEVQLKNHLPADTKVHWHGRVGRPPFPGHAHRRLPGAPARDAKPVAQDK